LSRHVYSIEIIAALAKSAKERLAAMGYSNVTARQGDGYQGWRGEAPFDRILLTAAPPDIPGALLDQLTHPGRLVAPVGGRVYAQELVVVDKSGTGEIHRRAVAPVRFVPMVPE